MEISALLDEMEEYARINNIPVMMSESAKMLSCMTACSKPMRILEIGTAIGYSGIIMLNSYKKAHLYTIEINENSLVIAKNNFKKAGMLDRVTFWQGDAEEIVHYLTGQFDLILLDGPKGHYHQFLPYLKQLMKSGSVLFADNVLFKGMTLKEGTPIHKHRTIITSLRGFLDDMKKDENFHSTLFEMGDGILISIKK